MTTLQETVRSETGGLPELRRKPAVRPSSPPPAEPDLPGCRPIPLPRRDLDTCEGRFEYWDGETETAWVCEPTGIGHEQPAMRLAGLCSFIAAARGAPIECVGSTDLELRDEHGVRQKILQADQCVYLYPRRASRQVVYMPIRLSMKERPDRCGCLPRPHRYRIGSGHERNTSWA